VAVIIERLGDLPFDRFGPLVAESEQAGWRFLRRLAEEWGADGIGSIVPVRRCLPP